MKVETWKESTTEEVELVSCSVLSDAAFISTGAAATESLSTDTVLIATFLWWDEDDDDLRKIKNDKIIISTEYVTNVQKHELKHYFYCYKRLLNCVIQIVQKRSSYTDTGGVSFSFADVVSTIGTIPSQNSIFFFLIKMSMPLESFTSYKSPSWDVLIRFIVAHWPFNSFPFADDSPVILMVCPILATLGAES